MRKSLLVMVLLLGLISGAAQAQTTPYCGSLAKTDCDTLAASGEAMGALRSAGVKLNMDMSLNNMGMPLKFTLSGDGAFAIDASALAPLLDSTDLTKNLSQYPELMQKALQAVSFDADMLLRLPDALSRAGNLPSKAGFSFRLVDGFLYFNLDKLAELDTRGSLPKGWYGFDFATYYRTVMAQSIGPLNDVTGDLPTRDPAFLSTYLKLERLSDMTLDGQTVQVYRSSYDLGALFANPDYQKLLRKQFEGSAALSRSHMTPDQAIKLYQDLFRTFKMNTTQYISPDDHYVRRFDLNVTWNLDMKALGSGGFGASTLDLNIDMQVNLKDFNAAKPIVKPERATIVPLNTLIPTAPKT
jgi:hypothetical protein